MVKIVANTQRAEYDTVREIDSLTKIAAITAYHCYRAFAQTYLPILQSYQAELLARQEMLVNTDSGTGQHEGIKQIMQHLQTWQAIWAYSPH